MFDLTSNHGRAQSNQTDTILCPDEQKFLKITTIKYDKGWEKRNAHILFMGV